MSADVWLEINTGGAELARLEDTKRNLTYDLTPMIRRAGFIGWSELMGKRAEDVEPMLRATVANLRANPDEYRILNPANGWGTYELAIEVLETMAEDCKRHPIAIYGGWL